MLLGVGTYNKGAICAWQFLVLLMRLSLLTEACGQMDLLLRKRHSFSWLNKHWGIKASHSPDIAPPHPEVLAFLWGERSLYQAVKAGRPFATPECGLEYREKSLLKIVGVAVGVGSVGVGGAILVYELTLVSICVLSKLLYFINQLFTEFIPSKTQQARS